MIKIQRKKERNRRTPNFIVVRSNLIYVHFDSDILLFLLFPKQNPPCSLFGEVFKIKNTYNITKMVEVLEEVYSHCDCIRILLHHGN